MLHLVNRTFAADYNTTHEPGFSQHFERIDAYPFEEKVTSSVYQAAKMAPTIEELDATVRGFYEGRGESQKVAQATLNQVRDFAPMILARSA
ncbi:hypothetical protein M7I_0390 [Glarea lozoyensis 74030]|uniref:Uncharacterized protein n=1 Tax=Glarea lozoyensis (strain ATCC 74030 / MF5533) TaxID=1104152 RepID=H0ED87_GLAL7|nr:hypothetical protein M7I_0390 [Glarea lozoyensis 74030]